MHKVLIASGASGGHVFPALAVAEELRKHDVVCIFVVGGGKFAETVQNAGFRVEYLPAAPWNVRNPLRKLWAVATLGRALIKAIKLVHKHEPAVVYGSGGYASVALMLAGKASGVPGMIQEQNVTPGRANRFLSRWVEKIAVSFEASRQHFKGNEDKVVLCGNPVRQQILDILNKPVEKEEGYFTILVLGGSLGAHMLSTQMPKAFAQLTEGQLTKIKLFQQARPEDVEETEKKYHQLGLAAFEVKPFFSNVQELIQKSDLVIGRAGGSVISECNLLGTPSILCPHMLADDHQLYNAKVPVEAGAALLIEEPNFDGPTVGAAIDDLMQNPEKLKAMAKAAKNLGQPNATKNVANAVLKMANADVMQMAEREDED